MFSFVGWNRDITSHLISKYGSNYNSDSNYNFTDIAATGKGAVVFAYYAMMCLRLLRVLRLLKLVKHYKTLKILILALKVK